MNDVTATPAGLSMGIDIDKPTPPSGSSNTENTSDAGTGTKTFLDNVSEEFRSKEWFQNIAKTADPVNELLKKIDNQESLIGRLGSKANDGLKVPGEGATAEDWANFHKALAPESADKYQYVAPTEVPEHLKQYFAPDEELLGTMKEAAIKAGVTPEGFKILANALDQFTLTTLDKQAAQLNETLGKLENSFKQKHGDNSTKVMDNFQTSLTSLTSKEQAEIIDQLDPRVKMVLAEYAHNFTKKYIREDNLDMDVPRHSAAMTQTEYGAKFGELYAKVRQSTPGSAERMKAEADLAALRTKGSEQVFKAT